MASKWQKLKGKLPDAPASDMASAADPRFLEKVELRAQQLCVQSLAVLMEQLTELNAEWDELRSREKELNVEFEAIGRLLKERFQNEGVTSMRSEGGQTFYLHIEPLIGAKSKDEVEQWVASDPALDYMWAVHPQTLATWVKDKLENVEEDQIPKFLRDSLLLKTSVRVRKS